jgi:hypothetical protein
MKATEFQHFAERFLEHRLTLEEAQCVLELIKVQKRAVDVIENVPLDEDGHVVGARLADDWLERWPG